MSHSLLAPYMSFANRNCPYSGRSVEYMDDAQRISFTYETRSESNLFANF